MPIIEVFLVEVSSAIAKSIFKLWLKDPLVGSDTSASLLDLLKSQTSDKVAQRSGQVQFELIGKKITENILPIFETQGAGLDEGTRTAIAHEVAKTFNKSKISSKLLIEQNLEPMRLAKYLIDSNYSGTRLFSELETSLYHLIINEACVYIVDIASELPGFTENSFAEILKREDQLIATADRVLQELRALKASEVTKQDRDGANGQAQEIINKVESRAIATHSTTDRPVQNLSEDKLGFAIYVRALRDFISSPDTSTPLTIAIEGPWGTGKTSLMRMLQSELDPPLSFWSWLWLKWLWLKWFWPFLTSLPSWMFGNLRIWIDDKFGNIKKLNETRTNSIDRSDIADKTGGPKRFQEIRASLTYKPDIRYRTSDRTHITKRIQDALTDLPDNFASIDRINITGRIKEALISISDNLNTIDKMRKMNRITNSPNLIQNIRAGMLYDPSIVDIKIEDLHKPVQKWVKIAAKHCAMVPLTHPTIWFNAWKFDQEEQLWAALALEVMNQIKLKYGYIGRILFWIRLTWKRSSRLAAFWSIIWKFVVPIILLVITVIYTLYMTSITNAIAFLHIYDFLGPFSPKGPYALFMPLILLVGAILSGIPAVKIIKDPFQISVKDILDKPNYKDKVGFIGTFEKDFSRIVSVATRTHLGWKPQKLVIFIDDLDRCEPPKVVDIIEGINLFLDSERCIFVLGMDSNAVIAGIETKYRDLFQRIQQETNSVVWPGRLFLDKIVQVPFHLPPSVGENKELLKGLDTIEQRKFHPLFTFMTQPELSLNQIEFEPPISNDVPDLSVKLQTTRLDPASYKHKDVSEAITKGVQFLETNPRQVKRFVNLFRLNVYIASERGMFDEVRNGNDSSGLTLNRLAIWLAWSIRWPNVVKPLFEALQISELRLYLMQIAKLVQDDGRWANREDLTDFSSYEKLYNKACEIRKKETDSSSHWCHLPWKWWLLDADFLKCIKELEYCWQEPQQGGIDYLQTLLKMNKVTLPEVLKETNNGNKENSTILKGDDVNVDASG